MTILPDIIEIKASLTIYFNSLNRIRENFYFSNVCLNPSNFSNKVFIQKRNKDEIMNLKNINVEFKFKE